MNEPIVVLIASIRKDLEAIDEIYSAMDRLFQEGENVLEDERTQITLAYRLHNLYNAFENIFLNIARTFENQLDPRGRWHSQLLDRMRLDLTPLRPAVIDDGMYEALDELRRFRHLFRHAYTMTIDPERLMLVYRKALLLRDIYHQQLSRLLQFLDELI